MRLNFVSSDHALVERQIEVVKGKQPKEYQR